MVWEHSPVRPELAAPAGNDLIMPGSDYDRACILKAIGEGTLSHNTVRRCACRVLRMMLAANTPVLIERMMSDALHWH